ncbi:MAG: alpha/beta fold hydrolase [Aquisalimonadaceae bacterium]
MSSVLQESSITVAGCRVRTLVGEDNGPPLLYLHGAAGLSRSPALDELAATHRVIAPEHPGFGDSDKPEWLDNIHDVALFYLELLKHENLSGVQVIGSSLGGWIGLEMALFDASRLAGLTLLAPAGIHVKGVPRADTFLWSWEEMIRNLFHDPSMAQAMLAEEPTDEQMGRIMRNREATARLGWAPRMYDPLLQKWLQRIDIPVLILWGDNDRLIPSVYAEHLSGLLPNARYRILADCGHLPLVEKKDEVLAEFRQFAGGAAA